MKEKRTERLECRIEPSLKDLLDNMAADEGLSMSDFVRTLLVREAHRYSRKHQKTQILRSKK